MPEETPPSKPAEAEEKSRPAYVPPKGATRGHQLHLDGQVVEYETVADWLVLRKKEKPVAEIFHAYYRFKESAPRPVTFVFNGGPGASSAYLHVGALGPKRVAFGSDGGLLAPPARLVDNEHTWLRFSDLVFVDPVGTGFSRMIEKPAAEKTSAKGDDEKEVDEKEFFQINRDLDALCEFISKFLSRHGLWSRPIFIAGESYGGFRVGKLARKLQDGHGVGLNGAILISPALELALLEGSDYDILMWADVFPSLVLASVHHGRSRTFTRDMPLDAVRAAAEKFAVEELVVLLAKGEYLADDERQALFARMADMLGLSIEFVAKRGGRMSVHAFTRELLADERRVCGLYDASATSIDPFPDRENFEGADPTLFAIERVFTSGINVQLRETLGVETERDYRLLSLDVNESWKVDTRKHAFESQVGATDDLRYGMALNPHMQVYICHGYYDLVTPYFASERLTRQMKLHPTQHKNLTVRNFNGGHMFYTWEASRQNFHDEMRSFFAAAVP